MTFANSEVVVHRLNIQYVLALVFGAVAFAMLFFSSFGPINSKFIPFNPMGWAGIFVYLAMITCYSQKYVVSNDNFWLILTLMFFPVLISDSYFFPIPTIFGFGMDMSAWMGVQVAVCFICFAVASKVKVLKYTNLSMLLLLPVAAMLYAFPQQGLPTAILVVLSFAFEVVITATLSYYAYSRKEYILIIGVVLNFLVSIPIPNLYVITGIIPFGWNQPFMAVVTDRIALFGRFLMVLGPLINAVKRPSKLLSRPTWRADL